MSPFTLKVGALTVREPTALTVPATVSEPAEVSVTAPPFDAPKMTLPILVMLTLFVVLKTALLAFVLEISIAPPLRTIREGVLSNMVEWISVCPSKISDTGADTGVVRLTPRFVDVRLMLSAAIFAMPSPEIQPEETMETSPVLGFVAVVVAARVTVPPLAVSLTLSAAVIVAPLT